MVNLSGIAYLDLSRSSNAGNSAHRITASMIEERYITLSRRGVAQVARRREVMSDLDRSN